MRRLPSEPAGDPPRDRALVAAQGLPNLLHELVHAVQAGRLDDDHGIDYGAIPFDLDTFAGRAVLWDELSCCVISCAYLWAHGRAARAGAAMPRVQAEVEAWFHEQVEIQPVFYGMEHDPPGFVHRVAELLRRHAAEVAAVLECASAATECALRRAGADPSLRAPSQRPAMATYWRALHSEAAAEPAAAEPAAAGGPA
ncbi:MAG: hypothetical protein KDK70_10520 [Myxococcales bacterium]|nr:hypothetical protein [Myxococcales bacterium]